MDNIKNIEPLVLAIEQEKLNKYRAAKTIFDKRVAQAEAELNDREMVSAIDFFRRHINTLDAYYKNLLLQIPELKQNNNDVLLIAKSPDFAAYDLISYQGYLEYDKSFIELINKLSVLPKDLIINLYNGKTLSQLTIAELLEVPSRAIG